MSERYWDISEKERAGLTREQVEAMLAYELMEQGVARPVTPTYEKTTEVELEGRNYYVISPFTVVFETQEQVDAFLKLRPLTESYEYRAGYDTKYAKYGDMSVSTKKLYNEADVLNSLPILEENKAIKERNERIKRVYEKACEAMREATSRVWEDWTECRNKMSTCTEIRRTYEEYVTLSGDPQVALKFLSKVYSSEDIEQARVWVGGVPEPEVACEECADQELAEK